MAPEQTRRLPRRGIVVRDVVGDHWESGDFGLLSWGRLFCVAAFPHIPDDLLVRVDLFWLSH